MSEEARVRELPSAPATGKGWRLAARPAGHILQAIVFSDAFALTEIAEAPFGLREVGPGRWLLVGETAFSREDISRREQRLGGSVALIEQGHGLERLELSGPAAAGKLAAGTAVNLAGMPEGASRQTSFGPIAIHLARTGSDHFELLVGRSFALSLWRALIGSE